MNKEFKQKYLLLLIERHGSVPELAGFSGISRRTLEKWKYGINEMPDHIYRYLEMLEDKTTINKQLINRIYRLEDWLYSDNSVCKEDKEYIDYELSYILTVLKGAYKITE